MDELRSREADRDTAALRDEAEVFVRDAREGHTTAPGERSAYEDKSPGAADALSLLQSGTSSETLQPFEALERVVPYRKSRWQALHQYATRATLQSLKTLNRHLKLLTFLKPSEKPEKIDVGDMSRADGVRYFPHRTHQHGREVDMRPVTTVYRNVPVGPFFENPAYSREKTQVLVDLLRLDSNVDTIFFNDPEIRGVVPGPGHDDHLHVVFKH